METMKTTETTETTETTGKQYKKCKHCGEVKPLREYNIDQSSKDGYNKYCRKCASWYNRESRHRALGMGRWNPFKIIDEERFYLNWETVKDGVKNWATGACTKRGYYGTIKNNDKVLYDW